MLTWCNGSLVSENECLIPVSGETFRFGYGLFETILVWSGNPILLTRHLNRMYQGAITLGVKAKIPLDELQDELIRLVTASKIVSGILRIYCLADGTLIAKVSADFPYQETMRETGLTALIAPIQRNDTSPVTAVKSLNQLDNILAKRNAQSLGYDEALFLNTRGNLAEGAVSNIFLVKQGKVISPDLASGILPGITREVVLEICTDLPIEVRPVPERELWQADECFLTNSLMGVMPLVKVGGNLIGPGVPGPITLELATRFRKFTEGF